MPQATESHTTSRPHLRAVPPALPQVQIAHLRLIAAIAPLKPLAIRGQADAADIKDRATHLDQVFGAFRAYLGEIVADTASNAPLGMVDKKYIDKCANDLAGEITGEIARVADQLAEWES